MVQAIQPWQILPGALAGRVHRQQLAATDFFTVEVWGLRGLVTCCVLIVIELSSRRVHFAGATPSPNTAWTTQIGRNLTDAFDGFLRGKRFVIVERDRKYCEAFRAKTDLSPFLQEKRVPEWSDS